MKRLLLLIAGLILLHCGLAAVSQRVATSSSIVSEKRETDPLAILAMLERPFRIDDSTNYSWANEWIQTKKLIKK